MVLDGILCATICGVGLMKFSSVSSLARRYRVAIIGAGPAGLAASNALAEHEEDVVLIDAGAGLQSRDHLDQARLTSGYGGAGLYSDGKFSFYPSATALWKLGERESLIRSFEWLQSVLGAPSKDIPPPVFQAPSVASRSEGTDCWSLKEYESLSLSLADREEMIERLMMHGTRNAVEHVSVRRCAFDEAKSLFTIVLECSRTGETVCIESDNVIFATGRMGPLDLLRYPFIEPVFRRLEVGVRIEQPAHRAFFDEFRQLDPKVTSRNVCGDVEWRTFCACRNGEIVYTQTADLWTVSGRSDCAPSGRSNIGFNTRVIEPLRAARIWSGLRPKLSQRRGLFRIPLVEILRGTDEAEAMLDLFGVELFGLVREGLSSLVQRFPSLESDESIIVGPSLEGVGWYPKVADDLSVPGLRAWVAGDACGKFRGLVGALVSGYFCGLQCVAQNTVERAEKFDSERASYGELDCLVPKAVEDLR